MQHHRRHSAAHRWARPHSERPTRWLAAQTTRRPAGSRGCPVGVTTDRRQRKVLVELNLRHLPLGVEHDPAAGVRWLTVAAEGGAPTAQMLIGLMYAAGEWVEKDMKLAIKWLRRAAEQGNAIAQHHLGACYHEGKGIKEDEMKAARWFRAAAEQGHAEAQFRLACLLAHGGVVHRNRIEAAMWYRRAAEQGEAKSQARLAVCCASGEGTARDRVEAFKWAKLAEADEPSMAELCSQLAERMPAEDVQRAEELARQWQARRQ